jgi:SAM-dependent methyltransferase
MVREPRRSAAERGIVELPAATFARNDRWTFDTEEGARFGDRLLGAIEAERTAGASTEASRLIATVRGLGDAAYQLTRSRRALVNRMLPRRVAHTLADYPGMRLVEDDFYVAVGHSKADLDIPAIREQMRVLRESGVEVVRLAEMARIARGQLELGIAPAAENDAREQLRRAHPAAPRLEDGDARSQRLQAMIPVDRPRVLHLEVADLPSIPFADGAFDCVCADDVLERAFDVDAALAEIRRVLADDGLLLAAIAPDAYGTRRIAEDHTWKTSAADVCERLGHAGFLDVSVEEADTYPLGAAPYPPSLDRLLHIQAWRRAVPLAPVDRVDALLHWTHEHCDPAGRTERAGMTLVLGDALTRERYEPRLVTMLARDHPRGRGPSLEETHAAIELTLPDRSLHVLDPMADVRFPCALRALIDDAALARDVERERDPSFLAHGYHLYASPFWYRRVVAVAACSQLREPHRFVPARWADHATEADYQALAFARTRAWRGLRRLRPA